VPVGRSKFNAEAAPLVRCHRCLQGRRRLPHPNFPDLAHSVYRLDRSHPAAAVHCELFDRACAASWTTAILAEILCTEKYCVTNVYGIGGPAFQLDASPSRRLAAAPDGMLAQGAPAADMCCGVNVAVWTGAAAGLRSRVCGACASPEDTCRSDTGSKPLGPADGSDSRTGFSSENTRWGGALQFRAKRHASQIPTAFARDQARFDRMARWLSISAATVVCPSNPSV